MKAKLLRIEKTLTQLPKKIKKLYIELKGEVKEFLPKLRNIAITNYKLGVYHIENGNMRDAKLRFTLLTKLKPEMAMPHLENAKHVVIKRGSHVASLTMCRDAIKDFLEQGKLEDIDFSCADKPTPEMFLTDLNQVH